MPIAELTRLRVQVQAAVLELAQMQAQRLVQVPELELARLRVLVQAAVLKLAAVLEPPLVRMQGRESARQQKLAVKPERVQGLRVSRQQEQQQHRLQAAAQELLPCRPVLPMKAPC